MSPEIRVRPRRAFWRAVARGDGGRSSHLPVRGLRVLRGAAARRAGASPSSVPARCRRVFGRMISRGFGRRLRGFRARSSDAASIGRRIFRRAAFEFYRRCCRAFRRVDGESSGARPRDGASLPGLSGAVVRRGVDRLSRAPRIVGRAVAGRADAPPGAVRRSPSVLTQSPGVSI